MNISHKKLCIIKAIHIGILLTIAFLILMAALTAEAGRKLAEVQQDELEFAVPLSATPDYEHSLLIDLVNTNPKLPAFRCGEIVRLKSNPLQVAIVFDSRMDNGHWVYSLLPAHYGETKPCDNIWECK